MESHGYEDQDTRTCCDECKAKPIIGKRFRCITCSFEKETKINFCEDCTSKGIHKTHQIIRMLAINTPLGSYWEGSFCNTGVYPTLCNSYLQFLITIKL